MRPLLFQYLVGSTREIHCLRVWDVTHLNEGKVEFIDVCLLLPHSCFVRCHFDSDTNNEISDS
jgi:hypothetical protein